MSTPSPEGATALEEERRALYLRAFHTKKMEALGQLTGGIAHEFNNLLAAIMGYIDLALVRFGDHDPMLKKYLEQSHEAGMKARDLVARLSAFGRMDNDDQGPLDPGGLHDSLAILKHVLPANIEFTAEIAADTPTPSMAAGEMNEILMNMVLNARDALWDGGRIAVRIARGRCTGGAYCAACQQAIPAGEYFSIEIGDNGHGIDPVIRDRLFEPFFTTRDPGKGTGLGLSVVHGIVHAHQGHLLLDDLPGGGTRFTVLLPVGKGSKPHLPNDAATPLPSAGIGKRVLIAEDEELVRDYMVDLLENDGLEVTSTSSGDAALALLRSRPDAFDMLLTDHMMPGISGIELARHAIELRPGLPVIICSAFSPEDIRPMAEHMGVCDILPKPLRVGDLRAAVGRAFQPH